MHALSRGQLERLEATKKRAHPPTPTGSIGGSGTAYPYFWDAHLPPLAPPSPFLPPPPPPISYLTRDAIVRMGYLVLSHLSSLCQFLDEVDPEGLQNSQLEIALGIVSRFTHNLDVARPASNSPRNKVCPSPYDQLPVTPKRPSKFRRTGSNPSLLRTSSKNSLYNTPPTTLGSTQSSPGHAPEANNPPNPTNPYVYAPVQTYSTTHHISHPPVYTTTTTTTYNNTMCNHDDTISHNPYITSYYQQQPYYTTDLIKSERLPAGESSLYPSREEHVAALGDLSAPPSGIVQQEEIPSFPIASIEGEEKEQDPQNTSKILSEIMATWGVKREESEDELVGLYEGKKGIKVKGAKGEMTIMPFRTPDPAVPRTPTPPPVVFSQFYPPQSLSLDSFEIGATLGTGTYGIVKLCKQKSTQNYFALKIVNKERISRLQQRRHIINEKKILMQVNHPFIVKLYTTFQDPQNIYFLMEFVPGGELFSHIRRNDKGYLSNTAACFYAAEIVLAIRYLHSVKVAHRDLKPENILLDEAGHARIVDFGFAKRITDRSWTMCGTPHYIAPEIILGKGHTQVVDFWSLGIMIYEMLAGHPPFAGSNKLEVFKRIVSNEPIEMPSHFQPLAKDLLRRLLMTDSTHRLGYGGVEEVMRHPWFQNLDWDALYHCSTRPPVQLNLVAEDDTHLFPQYKEGEHLDRLFAESLSLEGRPDNFWKGF